jgi:hypothetical protein
MEEISASVESFDDLVGILIKSGYKIKPICLLQRPFFNVSGTMIKVDEFKIQVYEYPDQFSRKQDLDNAVAEKRFLKKFNGFLEDEIHCWTLGRLNILYTEADRVTIRFLVKLFGPPYLGIDRNQLSQKRRQHSSLFTTPN